MLPVIATDDENSASAPARVPTDDSEVPQAARTTVAMRAKAAAVRASGGTARRVATVGPEVGVLCGSVPEGQWSRAKTPPSDGRHTNPMAEVDKSSSCLYGIRMTVGCCVLVVLAVDTSEGPGHERTMSR